VENSVLVRLDESERQVFSVKAIRVADYLGQVPVDDVVQRRVEVLEVVGSTHEDHVGRGGHAMHRLDVECLFPIPTLWVLLTTCFT
jgi:hypothetical protein